MPFYRTQGPLKDDKLELTARYIKVASQGNEQPAIGTILRTILITALIIVLPGVEWGFFGWVHIFLPLLAFYMLNKFGGYTGKRLLLTAGACSLVVYLLIESFDLFIFASALLFSGYILFQSAEQHDTPALSGLKGSITLAVGWIAVLGILSLGAEVSTYQQLIATLDEGIGDALEYYRGSDTVSADTLVMLEATLHQMKVIVPIIMPAILGSFILLITWFTMVMGNMLVLRTCENAPWASYRLWQLPEKLIWVAIALGLLVLVPTPLVRAVGINSLILLSIVYSFQGFAITVFFMKKWNVPLLLRSFFYVMIVFQSFGSLLLLFLGITDIWFDFRKLKPKIVNGID